MANGIISVKNTFHLNGKDFFLNSGEIHYFRIKKELWDTHLAAAREAGLNAVSSYVPWAWHEEEEGRFDFTGETTPEKDLQGWLERCRDHGLHAIVKPGPFILAETRGAGLPQWFTDRYGERVSMRNRKGERVASDGVNLFHPIYLEHVEKWYDRIMPLISRFEAGSGGPVILMQICNEIGVFSWLAHQGDYGEGVKERFIRFLKNKFVSVSDINRTWGKVYDSFEDVELPPDGRAPFTSPGDRSRDYEWHCFWRTYYGDYLRMLSAMARERGVTVPFYHNLPGWIYGHGYEFPVNITMYDDLFGPRSDIFFGVDHIPEFLSHRNMHDDRIINDITAAVQPGRPLFAAEFQCGSREYHVVTNPREMELFYKASIAHGLKGWNYYMFSQGRNRRRKGYSGDTFYWFTPLTPEGDRGSAFPLVRRMSRIIGASESLILQADRKAEICVLFYPPYYATELERPEDGASGLLFNYAPIRRAAWFDGLLKALQVLNIDYDMADLTRSTPESLGKYRQVWAFCTDEMNASDQQTLAGYAQEGGNLVVFPNLPSREMNGTPSRVLRDSVTLKPVSFETIDSPLIDIFGFRDIKCANPQVVFPEESPERAEIIARTIKGSPCGFSERVGKGTVTVLGTWLGFDTEGHKPVYETLAGRSGARLRTASSPNGNITVRERFTPGGQGLLFIGNYYNEEQTGKVEYTHPNTGEQFTIPFNAGEFQWPPLYAVLSPLCLEIKKGLSILHSTSDILGHVLSGDNHIRIFIHGDRDLPGEIVLEGELCHKISKIRIDNQDMDYMLVDRHAVIRYSHKSGKESSIEITL